MQTLKQSIKAAGPVVTIGAFGSLLWGFGAIALGVGLFISVNEYNLERKKFWAREEPRRVSNQLKKFSPLRAMMMDDPLKIPIEAEREQLHEYVEVLANLDDLKDLSDASLMERFSRHINIVMTYPYIMDQLLSNPNAYTRFLNVAKRSVAQQKVDELPLYNFKDASDFVAGLEKNIEGCKASAQSAQNTREDAERKGMSPVNEEYRIICPFIEELMAKKKQNQAENKQP